MDGREIRRTVGFPYATILGTAFGRVKMLMRLRTLGIAAAPVVLGLLAMGTAANPARASYVVNLEQVGSNVVATGSGSIDTAGLTFVEPGFNGSFLIPSEGAIFTGPLTNFLQDFYSGFTGPTSFGVGGGFDPGSGSGDLVGLQCAGSSSGLCHPYLGVPSGYVSGSALSDTSTYDDTTLSSIGVTPGTYVWTWGSGADADSFTLNIGATAIVPEPASLTLFGTAVLSFGAIQRRRRKSARALVSR